MAVNGSEIKGYFSFLSPIKLIFFFTVKYWGSSVDQNRIQYLQLQWYWRADMNNNICLSENKHQDIEKITKYTVKEQFKFK